MIVTSLASAIPRSVYAAARMFSPDLEGELRLSVDGAGPRAQIIRYTAAAWAAADVVTSKVAGDDDVRVPLLIDAIHASGMNTEVLEWDTTLLANPTEILIGA